MLTVCSISCTLYLSVSADQYLTKYAKGQNPYLNFKMLGDDIYMKKVFNGNFPQEKVRKMSRKSLENLVLKLVMACSPDGAKNAKTFEGLYKGLCSKEIRRPLWWPRERLTQQKLFGQKQYFMASMRYLVLKCSEFFKKQNRTLLQQLYKNDENCVKSGVKRALDGWDYSIVKFKRRTLVPKNSSCLTVNDCSDTLIFKRILIPLEDILRVSKPKTWSQNDFLGIFGLQNVSQYIKEKQVAYLPYPHPVKFCNSSTIPFSSDLGKKLMKRDNHHFSESSCNQKLEKLEWYINKRSEKTNLTHVDYEVTYQQKKGYLERPYKFPRRQHSGNIELHKILEIVVHKEDLLTLKQKIDAQKSKLKIKLQRLPVANHKRKYPVRYCNIGK